MPVEALNEASSRNPFIGISDHRAFPRRCQQAAAFMAELKLVSLCCCRIASSLICFFMTTA
jgi:hypothetical protein